METNPSFFCVSESLNSSPILYLVTQSAKNSNPFKPTKKTPLGALNTTEDMGFEPTHAFTRLLRFQHSLLSLLSNLPERERPAFSKLYPLYHITAPTAIVSVKFFYKFDQSPNILVQIKDFRRIHTNHVQLIWFVRIFYLFSRYEAIAQRFNFL